MNCSCGHTMRDLTHGYGEKRNFICDHCGSHFYNNVWYTKKEWEETWL